MIPLCCPCFTAHALSEDESGTAPPSRSSVGRKRTPSLVGKQQRPINARLARCFSKELEMSASMSSASPASKVSSQSVVGSGVKAAAATPPKAPQTTGRSGRRRSTALVSNMGWILKKGGGSGALGRRNWRKRFFVLRNFELRYFESETQLTSKHLKGIVPMQGAVVSRIEETKYEFQFQLSHVDGRVLDLRAESMAEMETWLTAMQQSIDEVPIDKDLSLGGKKLKLSQNKSKYMQRHTESFREKSRAVRRTKFNRSTPQSADTASARPSAAKGASVNKTERKTMRHTLRDHFLLTGVSESTLGLLLDAADVLKFADREVIQAQGETGDEMFILQSGQVKFVIDGAPVATKGSGTIFGELALLADDTRTATVRATGRSGARVWAFKRHDFKRIVSTYAEGAQAERVQFLRGVKLFDALTDGVIESVAEALVLERFRAGEKLIRQGDIGDKFFVLVSGAVRVTQRAADSAASRVDSASLELATLSKPGDAFGELALLHDEPRHASVSATHAGAVTCYTLDRAAFTSLLGPLRDRLAQQMALRTLRKMPLLESLSATQVEELSHAMKMVDFAPGEVIVREGEVGEEFFVVEVGTCVVSTAEAGGEEVARLTSGGYFGEVALLKDDRRHASQSACIHTR